MASSGTVTGWDWHFTQRNSGLTSLATSPAAVHEGGTWMGTHRQPVIKVLPEGPSRIFFFRSALVAAMTRTSREMEA